MMLTLISTIAALSITPSVQTTRPVDAGSVQVASTTTATTPNQPSAAAAPEEAPRQICRNVQVTGSRFPVRSCRNAVQSDAERREAGEMLRRMQGARTPPAS